MAIFHDTDPDQRDRRAAWYTIAGIIVLMIALVALYALLGGAHQSP
jgi:ABC-type uncharacterized transport system permease subunit